MNYNQIKEYKSNNKHILRKIYKLYKDFQGEIPKHEIRRFFTEENLSSDEQEKLIFITNNDNITNIDFSSIFSDDDSDFVCDDFINDEYYEEKEPQASEPLVTGKYINEKKRRKIKIQDEVELRDFIKSKIERNSDDFFTISDINNLLIEASKTSKQTRTTEVIELFIEIIEDFI